MAREDTTFFWIWSVWNFVSDRHGCQKLIINVLIFRVVWVGYLVLLVNCTVNIHFVDGWIYLYLYGTFCPTSPKTSLDMLKSLVMSNTCLDTNSFAELQLQGCGISCVILCFSLITVGGRWFIIQVLFH